jgi:integrase/recombinase XerD
MSLLAPTLQAFFTERLITQRDSSPQTVAAYRDTLRLLLSFAHERTDKQPCELDIDDLDAPLIGAFLTHLEHDRGNSTRTRNARLAAIHSLYRYMALRHPEHLQTIGRVIAIPFKRYEQNNVSYLNLDEIKALLRAPDRTTWLGRRDHALLLTAIQTGARHRTRHAEHQQREPRHRSSPPDPRQESQATHRQPDPRDRRGPAPVAQRTPRPARGAAVPTRQGRPLTRSGVGQLLAKHAATATVACASLKTKNVSPHTLRHTNAMLLRAGDLDIATIALWLGHDSIKTTRIYEHADPALKEQAIARIAPLGAKPGRYRPTDSLLAFLEAL